MSYLYDDFGRKLQETDALGRCWTFEYDTNGNVTKVTDPKGQILTYTYGYGHQLLTRNANGSLTTYSRNVLGQATQAASPDVTYSYTYDAAHRLNTLNDSRGNKTLTYTYSPAGLLTMMQDSDGNRTDYVYDPVGRLTGIWAPNNDLVSFIYDNGGRLIEKWFPTGVNTQYVYKADNTVLQLVNRLGSGTVLSQNDYIYDAAGNRVNHTEAIGGIARYFYYGYDNLNRLEAVGEWTEPDTRTPLTILENYTYDLLGNRTSKIAGGSTTAYIYDAANQLTEIRTGSTTGPLLSGFVYDASGNLTKKCEGGTVTVSSTDCTGSTVTSLTHDALNRLTQAAKTGLATQTYTYDDQGRRIQKNAGGTITNYLYSGPDVIGEYGSTWGSPAVLYTHGPNMDDPIIRSTSTAAQYYHQDGLGSVVGVSNQSGTTDATARYDAWGNTITSTGTVPLYGYTGREPDETGLVFYRARYYDPSIGRFVQRDPIGLRGGINIYSYVLNNPINNVDPWGLDVVLVPGSDVSGKRSTGWWQSGSDFAQKASTALNDWTQVSFAWTGGNTHAARLEAAMRLADLINNIPTGTPVNMFLHSHAGNVLSAALPQINRTIDLVVLMGTPARPDYQFDLAKIGQAVAISSQGDLIQILGGNLVRFPGIGEFGPAGREQPGFNNVLFEEGGHSIYHENPEQTMTALCGVITCGGVTVGPTDNAITGSGNVPETTLPPVYSDPSGWNQGLTK